MILLSEHKILYLANIVAMARADGQLSKKEVDVIETIQKTIGATKTELSKAYQQAENTDFQATPVGFFSDQIKNLEEMLHVSMVDGVVEDSEKSLLVKFACLVKVSQEQLNLIVNDVKVVLSNTTDSISCPICKTKTKVNTKFCPECGASIQTSSASESQSIPVSYDIPTVGVAIEFAESTASGFAHALKVHQEAHINATCVKGKKSWYLSAWAIDDMEQALKLVENIKGMRNKKVYIDGVESQWDDIFGFSWCANSRKSAYRPNEYCFGLDEKRLNVWGCKQSRMDWAEWADWFGYGSFKKTGILKNNISFVFDKERIKHELENNLYKCRLCPHIHFKLIEAVLNVLPDEVSLSEKSSWLYKRDYSESPGSILVKVSRREGNNSYTEEYYSSGVVPSSTSIGIDILKKAFKLCNYPASEIQGVLEYKG